MLSPGRGLQILYHLIFANRDTARIASDSLFSALVLASKQIPSDNGGGPRLNPL